MLLTTEYILDFIGTIHIILVRINNPKSYSFLCDYSGRGNHLLRGHQIRYGQLCNECLKKLNAPAIKAMMNNEWHKHNLPSYPYTKFHLGIRSRCPSLDYYDNSKDNL